MNERVQPALWGGVFIGVLSALPIVNFGNCCCCLWVICGGALAAHSASRTARSRSRPPKGPWSA